MKVCVVLLCVFTFLVPWCDVCYNFRIKTMFGSSLPPFVCRRAHVLFVFVAHSGVQHVLTVYMGNTASVLKEAETVYTSPAPKFTPVFWWGTSC